MSEFEPSLDTEKSVSLEIAGFMGNFEALDQVVNETLLEKEGLSIPENYEELIKVCEKLKEKGYTPIQASRFHASSDLVFPMAMAMIANDEDLKSHGMVFRSARTAIIKTMP